MERLLSKFTLPLPITKRARSVSAPDDTTLDDFDSDDDDFVSNRFSLVFAICLLDLIFSRLLYLIS